MAELLKGTAALEPFIARIKRENEFEARRTEMLHEEAFKEACRLAHEMGAADPELKKVILFGSALPERPFRSDSDVDLAVVGGHVSYFERLAADSTFHVDVVVLDDARAGIKESIRKKGWCCMQRQKADFERLIAELEADARDFRGLMIENARAMARIGQGAVDNLDWAALGYTIHNLYGVIENYCLRIAKFFENGLAQDVWHKELLRRMTLTIGDLRPAFLDEQAMFLIDELRSFRHLFRNLYARPLDPQRMRLVQEKVKPASESFLKAHDAYMDKLTTIAGALE